MSSQQLAVQLERASARLDYWLFSSFTEVFEYLNARTGRGPFDIGSVVASTAVSACQQAATLISNAWAPGFDDPLDPVAQARKLTTWANSQDMTNVALLRAREAIQLEEMAFLGEMARMRSEEKKGEPSPGTPPAVHPDGPEPPYILRWKGKPYPLTGRSWDLLKYMWDRQQATFEDAADKVWGWSVADATIKSAVTRLQQELLDHSVRLPWEFHTARSHICRRSV